MNQRKKISPSYLRRIWDVAAGTNFTACIVRTWKRLPKLHQRALMILMPLVIILFLFPSGSGSIKSDVPVGSEKVVVSRVAVPLIIDGEETNATKPRPKVEKVDQQRVSLSGPQSNEQAEPEKKPVSNNAGPEPWHDYTVKKGDTLSQVFRSNNLSLSDLNTLVAIEGKDKPLSQIQYGQRIRYKLTNRGDLDILQIEKDEGPVMFFRLSSGGFARSQP